MFRASMCIYKKAQKKNGTLIFRSTLIYSNDIIYIVDTKLIYILNL